MDMPAPFASDKPNAARMYDYALGGHHHFPIDREATHRATAIYPDVPHVARANRALLQRAVRALCALGVDQFLDIGSGLPTVENVHEIAQAMLPNARVVYVDYDPVTVAHSQAILELAQATSAVSVQADLRTPASILSHPQVRAGLDWERPVAVLMFAVLHFVPDGEQALQAIRTLRDALAPGSYMALSHGTTEQVPPDIYTQLEQLYGRSSSHLRFRSREEIAAFFQGYTLLDPGLVFLPEWRPEPGDTLFRDAPERSVALAGVGRKDGPEGQVDV